MTAPSDVRGYFTGTGQENVELYFVAHAELEFMMLTPLFGLGQLGALAHTDPEKARDLAAALRIDADDIEASAKKLADALREMVANAEAKL